MLISVSFHSFPVKIDFYGIKSKSLTSLLNKIKEYKGDMGYVASIFVFRIFRIS